MGGSFKRTFSTTSGETSRNFFRVWEGESQGYMLSVQTGTKKQWIDSINTAKKQMCVKKKKLLPPLPLTLPLTLPSSAEVESGDLTPTTPGLPISPPVEFITPQPKPPVSRVSRGQDQVSRDECDGPSSPSTPVSKLGPISDDKENSCSNVMTPMSCTSPKLRLRTDDHVLRLVMSDEPDSPKIVCKSSIV